MNYKTKDGLTLKAHTYTQGVTALRKSSKFDSECTNEEYIKHFTKRYKIATGINLPTDPTKKFVASLIDCGYLLKM